MRAQALLTDARVFSSGNGEVYPFVWNHCDGGVSVAAGIGDDKYSFVLSPENAKLLHGILKEGPSDSLGRPVLAENEDLRLLCCYVQHINTWMFGLFVNDSAWITDQGYLNSAQVAELRRFLEAGQLPEGVDAPVFGLG